MEQDLPIGFFDSGVGGLSVLCRAQKEMPEENFLYYGDSLHAPYGTKTKDEILRLVETGVAHLLEKGIKALVVACNTATSVAVDDLRARLTIPVISMEPAIKPALEKTDGKVLLMATEATIRSERVQALIRRYDGQNRVIPVPCRLLAKKIEDAVFSFADVDGYLQELLRPFRKENVTALVLGCTHYPLVKDRILRALGNQADVFDGIDGTIRHLRKELIRLDLKRTSSGAAGQYEILSSLQDDSTLRFYQRLLSGGTI